jgi:heat shock protein HslJ
MGQEARFLAALERVAKVQIQNRLLILLDAEGVAVFKASRKEKPKFQQPESTDRRLS